MLQEKQFSILLKFNVTVFCLTYMMGETALDSIQETPLGSFCRLLRITLRYHKKVKNFCNRNLNSISKMMTKLNINKKLRAVF